MKKSFSVVSLLVCVAIFMMGVIVYTMIFGNGPLNTLLFGYNPDQYITLGDYKGVTLSWEVWEPSQEEIDQAMEEELLPYATKSYPTVDAAEGDVLTIDYVGLVDGEEEDDFSDNERTITLGKDGFLVSGMDEYLLGADVGQPVTATLKVPENYHVEEHWGKTVEFTVTIKKILRTTLPELTPEFVKKLGDYTSGEDYKQKFAQQYRADYAAKEKAELRWALLNQVVKATTVEGYPEEELKKVIESYVADLQAGANEWGFTYYEYGMFYFQVNTEEEVDQRVIFACQEEMKLKMVVKAIARKEGLRVTNKEYETRMAQYLALETEFTEKELVDYYGGEEGMKEQFLLEMVTDVIEQNAVIQ